MTPTGPMGSYGFLLVLRVPVVPWQEQFRITMMMTTVVMSVLVTMIMLWVMMMMVVGTMAQTTAGLRLALSGLTIRAGNGRAPPQAQGVLHVQPMA